MWPFKFETYQDVKSNLTLATVVILYVACMVAYFWILPEPHARVLRNLRVSVWLKQIGLVVVLTVIAGFLIYGIQVHDYVYDHYVVKWRDRYTSEVILPKLCEPFKQKLDPRFFEIANANRHYFMGKLFYEYVHDREPRIRLNTVVRFYEPITNYWSVQILELATYLILLLAAVYFMVCRRLNQSVKSLIAVMVVSSLLLGLTSILGNVCRNYAQERTEDEIDEIHDKFLPDLEKRVEEISAKFKLKYG
ncbi:MAG TPA: hypothetical protein VGH51_14595 [Candidatus Angelobacter sp.]